MTNSLSHFLTVRNNSYYYFEPSIEQNVPLIAKYCFTRPTKIKQSIKCTILFQDYAWCSADKLRKMLVCYVLDVCLCLHIYGACWKGDKWENWGDYVNWNSSRMQFLRIWECVDEKIEWWPWWGFWRVIKQQKINILGQCACLRTHHCRFEWIWFKSCADFALLFIMLPIWMSSINIPAPQCNITQHAHTHCT